MDFKGLIRLSGVWFMVAAWLAFPGCDSPSGPGIARNDIEDVFPADGTTNQNLNVTLQWTFTGDTLKASIYFKVFLGTQSRPPLVADSLYGDKFAPGTLAPRTIYFWRVQAFRDTVMIGSSPVMYFKTGRSFTYPLAAGLRWDYRHEIFSYAGDGQLDPYPIDTGRTTVEILGTLTIHDTVDVYDLYIQESIGTDLYTGHDYVNNTDDGLYTYDYTILTNIAPRPGVIQNGTILTFARRAFDSPAQLFAFLRAETPGALQKRPGPGPDSDSPTRSYAYPLRLGSQWTYRFVASDGYPWRIDKKVIGRQQLTVPAGVFDCFVIQWFWDIDNDGRWDDGIDGYDYLAPQGLIKREFYVGKVGVTTYDNPGEMDYYDFYEGFALTILGGDN